MKARVADDDPKVAKYYKLKGITICVRWYEFENFLADMGRCPEGLELERRNNDLGYFPENCY